MEGRFSLWRGEEREGGGGGVWEGVHQVWNVLTMAMADRFRGLRRWLSWGRTLPRTHSCTYVHAPWLGEDDALERAVALTMVHVVPAIHFHTLDV
jgi:hypothetical protein